MLEAPELVHATVVAHGNDAALIRGPSGSGKSDLALRCLVHALSPMIPGPVRLVADDYVQVTRNGSHLEVRAPETLAGKLEVRGIGIIDIELIPCARLAMVVELVALDDIERLPDPAAHATIQSIKLPLLKLHAFEASAATKLLLTLARQF